MKAQARKARQRRYDRRRDPAYRKVYSARQHKKKRAIIDSFKSVPCMDCGKTYPTYVMDFDHRDPSTKLFLVSQTPRRVQVMLDEIAKCDVVCSNCHRERTFGHARPS